MPVIKSGNLMSLEVVLKPHNDYIEHPTQKMLASKIVYGDMLMCLSSQSDNPEPLGKTAIYKFDYPSLLNQRVLKFRPFFDSLTLYLYNVVNSFYFHYGVSHQGGGSAQANLKVEHVLGMLIPLAPQKEQCRIVNRIDELQPYISRFSVSKDNADSLNESLPIKLRKSILQEAIQGKLVPQDSTDEPASILLQRIKDQKLRLVKEGKLKKKDVVDSVIFKGDDNKYFEKKDKDIVCIDDEIPFEIPDSWVWVRLSFLVKIIGGTSYAKNDVSKNGIRILRGGNIQENELLLCDDDVFLQNRFYDEEKSIKKYDTIIVASTGSKAVIGKPAFIRQHFEGIQIGAFLRIIRPFCNIYAPFLELIFSSEYYRKHIRDSVKGTNINNIKAQYLEKFLIPLPSIEEQARIMEKYNNLASIMSR